jgi:flavin-binding protein dodecin
VQAFIDTGNLPPPSVASGGEASEPSSCVGARGPGQQRRIVVDRVMGCNEDGCKPTGVEGRQVAAVKGDVMSVYKVIDIIGTSGTSWEDAAAEAVRTTAQTIRDLRVAEVVEQDIHLDEGGAITYRTKLQISFKYEPGQ